VIALVIALPAAAQDATAPIIVTGKVPGYGDLSFPGSSDTFGPEQLEARKFEDLTSLSHASPNVSLDAIGTFKGVANFAIRGLGINSSIPSIDPAVGLFVDGVYIGVNAGTVFDALDVERVDILRGPQGVAFGRNTTGGAVLVQTADPTWDSEGYVRAGFDGPVDEGRGAGQFSTRAVYSGPLSDSVAVRVGALYSNDRGYFENRFDGRPFGREETGVLRGAVALKPSDRLSLVVKGEWTGSSGDGATTHNNGQNARDRFDLSVNQRGFYDSEAAFVTAHGELELGPGKLTDIFGWRRYDLTTRNDIDSSPLTLFHSDTATRQRQWSNELFYAAAFGSAKVAAGAYLFGQDVGYDESRDLTGLGATLQYGGGREEHDVYGLYASAEVPLAPKLTLSGGLRWSREEKSAAITYVRPRAACSAIAGTCPITGARAPGENNGFTDERSWDSLSPRVAVSYTPMPNLAFYGSWTRGQRSGGYNLRITQPAAFEQVAAALGSPAYDQEQVDSFELGAKWRAADGLAEVRAAAFRSEVDNLQREINVPSATSGLAQSIYNTADARITGGELELRLAPAAGLELAANLGLTDAQYTRAFFDINSDGVIDAADLALALPRAPKATWGGSVGYAVPIGGRNSLRADVFFQHRDRFAYTDNNWGFNSASDRLDATLALKHRGLRLTLYGRNLLDEVQFGGDTQLPFAGGPFSDGNNRPFDPRPAAGTFSPVEKGRVLGVELGAEF
jgi:iron complex outermembrane receptor protein